MEKKQEEQKKQNFWTTLPGIFTGLAAIITAIGGLIAALITIGALESPFPPPTPLPPSSDAPIDTAQPIDTFKISSNGEEVTSTTVLGNGQRYTLIVVGTFNYNTKGRERGIADAQLAFREATESWDYVGWLQIDGDRLVADEEDPLNNRYAFYIVGSGDRLRVSIWDSKYVDNRGALRGRIYPGVVSLTVIEQ
jgi:hypothetical protein